MRGTPFTLKCPSCKRGKYGHSGSAHTRRTGLVERRVTRSAHGGFGTGGPRFVGHRGLAECQDCGHRWFSTHPNSGRIRCYGPGSTLYPCTPEHARAFTTPEKLMKHAKSAEYACQAPCSDCPFLKVGGIRLTEDRIYEISDAVLGEPGAAFWCHKTTTPNDSDEIGDDEAPSYMTRGTELHCAGALNYAEAHSHATQLTRIMERLGLYDRTRLQGADRCFQSLEEWLATAWERAQPPANPPRKAKTPCRTQGPGGEKRVGRGKNKHG